MSQLIHGVFETRDAADDAVRAIERETGRTDGLSVVVHEKVFRDEDVQFSGTNAIRSAASAAALVGVVAACIGAFVMAPAMGMPFGWAEFALVALAGTVFGVVAGMVAGASESRKSLEIVAAEVGEGKIGVTIDAERAEVVDIVVHLKRHGARHVKAA